MHPLANLDFRWNSLRWRIAKLLAVFFSTTVLLAQPLQREWIRTYALDASKTNHALLIAVAPDGNIVVAGNSQSSAGDLDYQIIKYKPNGDELWKAHYGSANGGDDQLTAMAIDPSGNIIVTGTSDTVKFNNAGRFVWSAPLPGQAVIANAQFIYVTGFSDNEVGFYAGLGTAQLENNDLDGKENWRRFFGLGADIGRAIALDANGNVYVAGKESAHGLIFQDSVGIVSYDSGGVLRLEGEALPAPYIAPVIDARQIIVAPSGEIYIYATYSAPYGDVAAIVKFSGPINGVASYLGGVATSPSVFATTATRAILSNDEGVLAAGGFRSYDGNDNDQIAVVTSFTSDLDRKDVWHYIGPTGGLTQANDLARDSRGILYVTGYSDNDRSLTNSVLYLARISPAGQTLGLDLYPSVNALSGNNGAALAIDSNDNVYVTGYIANTQGGSEFVTIKYSALPTIQQTGGTAMHLEFHTSPGHPYAIETSADFVNWQSVITNTADANGLIRFDDTNALSLPYRFYRGNSVP